MYLHKRVRKVHAEVCGEVLLNKEVLLQAVGWEREDEHIKGVYLRMVLRRSEI